MKSKLRLVLWFGFIHVSVMEGAPQTRYVWPSSPSPAPPFTTWSTAARTIQDAVDAAVAGDTVLVTNGFYATGGRVGVSALTNRVTINKAIRVESVSGPAVTMIAGTAAPGGGNGVGATRCVLMTANAFLNGFTLTNGHTLVDIGETDGGGASCVSGGVISNCVFRGNFAANDGAGVSGGTIYRSLFTGNTAGGDGGGADRATLINCVITGNYAGDAGGADDCVLYGCFITDNVARERGGGTFESLLYHCTVTGNSAHRGGGVAGRGHPEHSVYNSIVFGNKAAVGMNHEPLHVPVPIYYSCTTPLPPAGTNNIDMDPIFASATRPALGSPCRGAGSAAFATGVDIDGEPWSNPPSMGADEAIPGATTGAMSVAVKTDYPNVAPGFMAVFKGFVEGPVTRNEWRFDDGKIFTNLLQVVHAWEAVGARPVVFTAFNDSYPGGISATTIVNVAIAPTAYVDIASVTPAPPFASWQTAATTIQEAVDVGSIAGRVVWVTNGIYSTGGVAIEGLMTNRVALKDGVTVRSVNGPDVTLITGSPALTGGPGDGALRCAYLSDGSVLSGFTLTNGNTRSAGHTSREQGGGGAWSTSRGVLTNCVLVGNQAARDGGGVNGGRLYRCVLTGNLAYDDGGGADDSVLFDCILTNNEAINGGGAADESTLERCTIVNNRAQLDGGGTDDSTLRDCLLRGNIATSGPAAAADGYFYGCTIVHHPSPNYPFVVLDAFIYNSIVYHNERTNQHDSVMFYHSCTTPAPPGGFGNITNAPAFVNMNSGNFRLLPGFPGIDAGLDLTGADARDLDGNRRPVDGNGDGISRFDMGAFEFTPPRFITARRTNATVIVSWTPAPGFRLERAAALPAIPWTDVSITNGQTAIEWPMGSGNEFFRLIHP